MSLEDKDDGTLLTYEVEANVGGKIAQVGSRLIDMTAKKMADIFFGKFSELISMQENPQVDFEAMNDNQKSNIPNQTKKFLSKKIIIYISALIFLGITAYLII